MQDRRRAAEGKPEPGRWLQDPALAGAVNMARDEALLEAHHTPTLRFYRWDQPTVSLGYFQAAADLPLEQIRARGWDLVRRSTGGKAILHQRELTYALCLPETGALRGGPGAAMTAVHEALAAELQRQGGAAVELRDDLVLASDTEDSVWCFEDSSPLDLTLGARKLVGSAARRRDGWILFHGSLVIARPDANPDIAELGFEPDAEALAAALGSALGYDFHRGNWSVAELEAAAGIHDRKYADRAFTHRR